MTRSKMREHIFKVLFRAPFYERNELDEQIRLYFEEYHDVSESDYEYMEKKILNIADNLEEIDNKINEVSVGWPVDRLGKAELSIIRLAVYEMLYDDDIPVNVAINEAVELAKVYGSDDSTSSFVNGVLAKLV
ncbi:MAG: transcription antitermination factor NusB [Eubacteriales bacterium]|nr:transcription antitermination factor NusB [Eubacteriales bacterium]